MIAGTFAEFRLCKDASDAVDDLLGGESLAEAGLWADRIRRQPEYRHTGPWHYWDVRDDVSVFDARHPRRGDVVETTERMTAVLEDPRARREDRRDALKYVIHFVVDLHQPLHIGRPSDRGGNEIRVMIDGDRTNLHAAWDGRLLRASGRWRWMWFVDVAMRVQDADSSGGVYDWAEESRLLRAYVYDFGRADRGSRIVLDRQYIARASDIMLDRLAQAGVRLAAHLNDIFCDPKLAVVRP